MTKPKLLLQIEGGAESITGMHEVQRIAVKKPKRKVQFLHLFCA